MSVPKPSIPCKLVKQFALGADIHKYFADTFNWIVSCLENFKGVEGMANGSPEVIATAGGAEWTGGFSYVDGKLQEGCVIVGRTPVKVAGLPLETSDGVYCVKVTVSASTPSAELVSGDDGFNPPDGDVSYIPLCTISEGKVTADYRGATTIPVWE